MSADGTAAAAVRGSAADVARAGMGWNVVAMLLALSAAAIRLVPLQWLHPLNWDELEFYRATRWIAEGRVPFRDFWEHHTPLTWLLFAPVAGLVESPGVHAIIALRWAQIPVWVVAFWLMNVWMRREELDRFARWAAIAVVLSSSMFMIPAIEYRVEAVAILFVIAALVAVQRERFFAAGLLFAAAVFANLRFAPMIAVAALIYLIARCDEQVWQFRPRALGVVGGGVTGLAGGLGLIAAAGALPQFLQQVWTDNLAEKYATAVPAGFVHRLLVPFGIRIIASERPFDPAGIDVGGVVILVAGFSGLVLALRRWRSPDHFVVLAVLQITNLLFVAAMKFIYNYHLLLVAALMIPFIAVTFTFLRRLRPRATGWIAAVLLLAWSVNLFASLFRGKELDRAYQDLVMREVHARTKAGDRFWGGMPWALEREPAYRFWFLPELARQLVAQGLAEPYELAALVADPPAAVVFDHNALVWVVHVQRELAPFLVRHYIPVWRNLWMPGMNARLQPEAAFEWVVPRDGTYRIHASRALANHVWFRNPLLFVTQKGEEARRSTVSLPAVAEPADLRWWVDGEELETDGPIPLRRGQRLGVLNRGKDPLAVIVYAGADQTLFRQPPPGVTLEGETARVTHWPRPGATIE